MKESVTHSIGPWCFRLPDPNSRAMSQITREEDPEFIIGYALCDDNKNQRPEDIANARVMAASPDLLVACREALIVFNSNSTEIIETSDWNRITRILRDAISKAEGE